MSTNSKIQWTDATWNPVRGCTRVSAGCENCYAERMASRFFPDLATRTPSGPRWTGRVEFREEELRKPLHWRKPRKVFVCSMGDLFHENVPDEVIARVLGTVVHAQHHTFMVLTKRPERMAAFFADEESRDAVLGEADRLIWDGEVTPYCDGWKTARQAAPNATFDEHGWTWDSELKWPIPNLWLGVSVENQEAADERIPVLLETPAAVRFLSCEPLLGPVDLGLSVDTCTCCERWPSRWIRLHRPVGPDNPYVFGLSTDMVADAGIYRANSNAHGALSIATPGGSLGIKPREFESLGSIDWVIEGGETGPHKRPMDLDWARSIRNQCRLADVPFFYKQDGRGNHYLDGCAGHEYPESLEEKGR